MCISEAYQYNKHINHPSCCALLGMWLSLNLPLAINKNSSSPEQIPSNCCEAQASFYTLSISVDMF